VGCVYVFSILFDRFHGCLSLTRGYARRLFLEPRGEIESFGCVVIFAIVYQVFEPEKIRIMTHRATMGFNPRIDSLDREGYVVIVIDLYTGIEGGSNLGRRDRALVLNELFIGTPE
jgi:hypothetical protein